MNVSQRRRAKSAGYSMVEMMMTLAIGLILVSVALPTLIGAVQAYRLNSATQQVASLVELARYTAIRRNAVVSVLKTVQSGNTIFYIDTNGNSVLDANEPMVMLPSDMQLANGQPLTPSASTIGLSPTQDFSTQMTFDYRGTVNFSGGGPVAAYFLALGYVSQAQYGCRAITVTPMGQAKMWKAPPGGPWTGM
ncbi:MAG TPA: GspH/FimT family pseudopilin [Candidatus Acidoferrum sp.]|nr:GspH/FimT family pseudopilin [Candidatus Acidoferrum sp.]